jgi:hypothetical protein
LCLYKSNENEARDPIVERYSEARGREYRPISPGRRAREGYMPYHAPPASGDYYRPEIAAAVDSRHARSADCYRPAYEEAEPYGGSSYTPIQPGPQWRRHIRSPSPRGRTQFAGSHWDPNHDRSFSGSPTSRVRDGSHSPRSPHERDRRETAHFPRNNSRSSSVSSVSHLHALPSRPLMLGRPTFSQPSPMTVDGLPMHAPFIEGVSSTSTRALHPSLPPRPITSPKDRFGPPSEGVDNSGLFIGSGLRGAF